jgi:hypothetical protein
LSSKVVVFLRLPSPCMLLGRLVQLRVSFQERLVHFWYLLSATQLHFLTWSRHSFETLVPFVLASVLTLDELSLLLMQLRVVIATSCELR